MVRSRLVALGIAVALVPVGVPVAAAQSSAAAQFDARASADEIRRLLRENYVIAETGAKLDAKIAASLAAGRYNVSDHALFAQLINEDMSAVTNDKHLGVLIDPKTAAKLAANPPGAGADDAPPTPAEIAEMERNNHGLAELKLLPGNIRYLEITGFDWAGPSTAAAYDDAFRFLRGGDAIIIDIRRNGGGSPDAVQYLVSHFLEPNRPIMTFHMGKKVDRRSSLAKLPSGRVIGKPLYVLTSGNSGSAAEEFAGHVGGFKLGELVGETTAGAGFRNEFFRVNDNLVISISVGRAVLASTGKDWEGVGIVPTMPVTPAKALAVAQVHALRRLAAAAAPVEKRKLEAAATLLSAQTDPVRTALALPDYAGTYGERTLTLENGKLMYRRLEGPKVPLVPVGANEFAFELDPVSRLHFTVEGSQAKGFEFVRPDGSRVAASRTQ